MNCCVCLLFALLCAILVFTLGYIQSDSCPTDKLVLEYDFTQNSTSIFSFLGFGRQNWQCYHVSEVEINMPNPSEAMQRVIETHYPKATTLTLHSVGVLESPFNFSKAGYENIHFLKSEYKRNWFEDTNNIISVHYISSDHAPFRILSENFPNLRVLQVRGSVQNVEGNFTFLEELNISSTDLSTLTMEPKEFPALKELFIDAERLSDIKFTSPVDSGLKIEVVKLKNTVIDAELCQLLCSPQISVQTLGEDVDTLACTGVTPRTVHERILSFISAEELVSLTIQETEISQEDLDLLDDFSSLEKLNLANNEMADKLHFRNPKLKELDMSACKGKDGNQIQQIFFQKALDKVILINTEIHFATILALAAKEIPEVQFNCQNRKEIDLSKQMITRIPSGFQISAQVSPKLETLDINDTGDHLFPAEILSVRHVKFNGKVLGVVLDSPTFENFPPWFADVRLIDNARCEITSSSAINMLNGKNLIQLSRFSEVIGTFPVRTNSKLSFAGLSSAQVSKILSSPFFTMLDYTSIDFQNLPEDVVLEIPDAIWANTRLLNTLQSVYFNKLPDFIPDWLLQKDVHFDENLLEFSRLDLSKREVPWVAPWVDKLCHSGVTHLDFSGSSFYNGSLCLHIITSVEAIDLSRGQIKAVPAVIVEEIKRRNREGGLPLIVDVSENPLLTIEKLSIDTLGESHLIATNSLIKLVDISNQNLVIIPAGLNDLGKVEKLNCSSNKFTNVEISVNVDWLDLTNCNATEMTIWSTRPVVINNLNLKGNNLRVPPTMNNIQVATLILANNPELEIDPSLITRQAGYTYFSQIQNLRVDYTKVVNITDWPNEKNFLRSLKSFSNNHTINTTPEQEIVQHFKNDFPGLLSYVNKLDELMCFTNVIVIGDPASGKTMLFNLMAPLGHTMSSEPTVGLDSHFIKINGCSVSWYDFGGQSFYSPLHPLMFKRAVFMLVWDTRIVLHHNPAEAAMRLRYWLDSINESVSRDDQVQLQIYILGNFVDSLPNDPAIRGRLDETEKLVSLYAEKANLRFNLEFKRVDFKRYDDPRKQTKFHKEIQSIIQRPLSVPQNTKHAIRCLVDAKDSNTVDILVTYDDLHQTIRKCMGAAPYDQIAVTNILSSKGVIVTISPPETYENSTEKIQNSLILTFPGEFGKILDDFQLRGYAKGILSADYLQGLAFFRKYTGNITLSYFEDAFINSGLCFYVDYQAGSGEKFKRKFLCPTFNIENLPPLDRSSNYCRERIFIDPHEPIIRSTEVLEYQKLFVNNILASEGTEISMWRNGISLRRARNDSTVVSVYFQVDQNYDFIQVFIDIEGDNCDLEDNVFDEITTQIRTLFSDDKFHFSVVSASDSDLLIERQRERKPFQLYEGSNKVRKVKKDEGYEDYGIMCFLNSMLGEKTGPMRTIFTREDVLTKVVIPDTEDDIKNSDLLLVFGPNDFQKFVSFYPDARNFTKYDSFSSVFCSRVTFSPEEAGACGSLYKYIQVINPRVIILVLSQQFFTGNNTQSNIIEIAKLFTLGLSRPLKMVTFGTGIAVHYQLFKAKPPTDATLARSLTLMQNMANDSIQELTTDNPHHLPPHYNPSQTVSKIEWNFYLVGFWVIVMLFLLIILYWLFGKGKILVGTVFTGGLALGIKYKMPFDLNALLYLIKIIHTSTVPFPFYLVLVCFVVLFAIYNIWKESAYKWAFYSLVGYILLTVLVLWPSIDDSSKVVFVTYSVFFVFPVGLALRLTKFISHAIYTSVLVSLLFEYGIVLQSNYPLTSLIFCIPSIFDLLSSKRSRRKKKSNSEIIQPEVIQEAEEIEAEQEAEETEAKQEAVEIEAEQEAEETEAKQEAKETEEAEAENREGNLPKQSEAKVQTGSGQIKQEFPNGNAKHQASAGKDASHSDLRTQKRRAEKNQLGGKSTKKQIRFHKSEPIISSKKYGARKNQKNTAKKKRLHRTILLFFDVAFCVIYLLFVIYSWLRTTTFHTPNASFDDFGNLRS